MAPNTKKAAVSGLRLFSILSTTHCIARDEAGCPPAGDTAFVLFKITTREST